MKYVYRLYRNLNNGLISIRCKATNLVVGHAEEVIVSNPNFKVIESGRLRVIATKEKNVHAFVEGEIISYKGFKPFRGRSFVMAGTFNKEPVIPNTIVPEIVSYNPYKFGYFFVKETVERVGEYRAARVKSDGKIYAYK